MQIDVIAIAIGIGTQFRKSSWFAQRDRELTEVDGKNLVCVYPNGATEESNVRVYADSVNDLKNQIRTHPEWQYYQHEWQLFTINGLLKAPRSLPVVSPCLQVFVVPSHRPFQWPALELGKEFKVQGTDIKGITITPVAKYPRTFVIRNFLKPEEASNLKSWATDARNPHKLAESTVGHETKRELNTQAKIRTSENAFDVQSPEWKKVGKRIFDIMRMEYNLPQYDGLQIVRYRKGQAYNFHDDAYFKAADSKYNWDSTTMTGGNRYATLFIYLQDVAEEAGGQTVFSKAYDWISPFNRTEASDRGLESMKQLFGSNSWEYSLSAKCFSGDYLAMRPKAYTALLFYSQDGMTGALDHYAEHAACPVVTDAEKWGANAWIWNNPRYIG